MWFFEQRTRHAGSNGSYFLLLIFSNSSLNCSKIFNTNALSVLPLTPTNPTNDDVLSLVNQTHRRFRLFLIEEILQQFEIDLE